MGDQVKEQGTNTKGGRGGGMLTGKVEMIYQPILTHFLGANC